MLRYRADLRTLGFVATYFALIVLAYTVDLPGWGEALLVPTISVLSFFCAVITHNTVHSPVFRSRGLNRVFQAVISLTYGHPVSMFVPGHNLSHHKYLQTPKDRMRTDKMRFRWNLLNQLMFNNWVGGIIFKDNLVYARQMRTRRPVWFRQLMVELAIYLTFVLVTLAIDWRRFLLFVLIPHQYAVWGIVGINFIQHDGCDPDDRYNHSRNFPGKLLNWFTFNNGFHGIHHLHPSLHWSLAPEAHARELAPHLHPGLSQPSLLAYCFRVYVWPGVRIRHDGTPLVLPPPRQDEPWIPAVVDHGLSDASDDSDYGAVA